MPVTLNSTVLPTVVIFNITNKGYTLSGSGSVSGTGSVVVNGGATLTNNLVNNYTGGTTLNNNSALLLGAGASIGTGKVNMGAGTSKVIVSSSSAVTLPTLAGTGGTPQIIQNGAGVTSLTGSAADTFLSAVVNNGTLQLAAPSTASVHALGSSSTINSGGILQLAGSGGDQLANAGSILMEISYDGVATNADRINVATNLVLGGTLTVTNVGPNPLAAGQSFKLFNAPSYTTGTFASVTLPALSGGLGWTNKLALNGTIAVVATAVTTPTNITAMINGSNLELSWPADHTGWRLQVQTNSLSVGLVTNLLNWVTITNTELSNSYTNTIDTVNGTVFYRMVYP